MIIYVFTIFSAVEMWGEQTLRQQFGHGEDKRGNIEARYARGESLLRERVGK